jgi:adenylate kinase family enzyme
MRITIIGASGSGKSALSRKISESLRLPRLEIDRLWFKHRGHTFLSGTLEEKEAVMNAVAKDIEDFLSQSDTWVIEGTYSKIQPRIATKADVVIYIKRSLLKRIVGHLIRVLRAKDRHPEVTKMQDFFFIKTILKRWKGKEDKKLEEFAQQYQEKLVILSSFREIDAYFESLVASHSVVQR